MWIRMLKSKLHMARITGTKLHYHGSITIPSDLMEAAHMREHEAVLIANVATGDRGETYIIEGPAGSGQIELNGAIARMAEPGDAVIVMTFASMTEQEANSHQPTVILLDETNRPEGTVDHDDDRGTTPS